MVHININENCKYNLDLEHDLQVVVANYLRNCDVLFTATTGGFLDTTEKRLRSWEEGYQAGVPDIMIYTSSGNGKYCGLALELKRPDGKGSIPKKQVDWLNNLEKNGWFCMSTNDLVLIIETVTKYVSGTLK